MVGFKIWLSEGKLFGIFGVGNHPKLLLLHVHLDPPVSEMLFQAKNEGTHVWIRVGEKILVSYTACGMDMAWIWHL